MRIGRPSGDRSCADADLAGAMRHEAATRGENGRGVDAFCGEMSLKDESSGGEKWFVARAGFFAGGVLPAQLQCSEVWE